MNISIMNMENNDKVKEKNIKNRKCSCFDDIIKCEDFNLDNISPDEKFKRKYFGL